MPAKSAPETPYRITDYPMHYFAAIQRQNQLNLARSLREFGLSVPMWRALSALHQKDGQTIGEIAQLAVLDRSSLGRLLDEMAKAKLVEREPLPDDRRALAVVIVLAWPQDFRSDACAGAAALPQCVQGCERAGI